MRLLVFLVYFCSLLFTGGGQHAYAGIRQNITGFTQSHNIEKKQQLTFSNTNQPCNIIKDLDIDRDDEYLVNDDVENEDSNDDVVVKKCKLSLCYQLARSHPSILSVLFKSVKAPAPSGVRVYYIYITQRALRI